MATSRSDTSIYRTLRSGSDEIRLVTIKPASKLSEEVHCNIESVRLSTSPEYQALSYAWGDASITEEINVDGTVFRVTTNLASALRRLRLWKEGIRFWIDAICINQTSVFEKNHQIPLMGRIYSQAEGVIMWLGEEENNSSLAIAFLNRWHDGIFAAQNNVPGRFGTRPLEAAISFIEDPIDEQSIQAVNFLLMRSYWSRIWIIQEIVLAKTRLVLCGAQSIEFDKFELTIDFWRETRTISNVGDDALKNDIDRIFSLGPLSSVTALSFLVIDRLNRRNAKPDGLPYQPDVLLLIKRSLGFHCTDSRDRLYSLFGLMDSQHLPMQPNYQLSLEEVNTSFTTGLVQASLRLDAISLAGLRSAHATASAKTDYSTWVPEYISRSSGRRNIMDLSFTNKYRAAKNAKAEFTFQHLHILHARGMICSKVMAIDDPGTDKLHLFGGEQEWLWKWLALAEFDSREAKHPTGILWLQAFFRTLTCDPSDSSLDKAEFNNEEDEWRFHNLADGFMSYMRYMALQAGRACLSRPARTDEMHLDLSSILELAQQERMRKEIAYWTASSSSNENEILRIQLLEKFCGKKNEPNSISLNWPFEEYGSEEYNLNIRNFVGRIAVTTAGRSFFVTQEGYMGLAPRSAKKGDLICVLLGCSVPVIIRNIGTNYLVVGDTYVYGMMLGEMVEEVEKGRLHLQDLIFE